MIVWLEPEVVIAMHEEQLTLHGGLPGLRDENALRSALQRPQNLYFYEDVHDLDMLAASYLVGVAKAHAFADANKRTAWMSAVLFIELNAPLELTYEDDDAIEMVVGAASSALTVEDVAAWLHACTH